MCVVEILENGFIAKCKVPRQIGKHFPTFLGILGNVFQYVSAICNDYE